MGENWRIQLEVILSQPICFHQGWDNPWNGWDVDKHEPQEPLKSIARVP